MIEILGTFPRPGRWNWSFGTWFYRKLSRSPRDKKIKHVAKCIWRNFFKLAHYVYCFSECNSISDIHPKPTDHCFQKISTKFGALPLLQECPQSSLQGWRWSRPMSSSETFDTLSEYEILSEIKLLWVTKKLHSWRSNWDVTLRHLILWVTMKFWVR